MGDLFKLCLIRDWVCVQKPEFSLLRTAKNWSLCTAFGVLSLNSNNV